MAIIITGSTGFVGKNLIDYFAGSEKILTCLLRDELSCGDFTKVHKVDSIIHLAGKAHALKKVSDANAYYEINFELTKKLYDEFLKSEAKKFIFISSVKASADQVDIILKESDPANPQTHYGKSKLMAEEYITSLPLPEGKQYYILRPCMIHGPGNKGNLNLLHRIIAKGIPYPLASFDNKRSFLSIENLCFVIKEILERNDIPSGIYNMADDDTLSTNHLVKLLAEAQGIRPRLWYIHKSLISFGAMIGDKLKLPFNSEQLQKLTENYVVSNDKIKQALGKSLPVTVIEGILRTAKSFRAQ